MKSSPDNDVGKTGRPATAAPAPSNYRYPSDDRTSDRTQSNPMPGTEQVQVPVVLATYYPPAGRRTTPLYVVRCPYCRGYHAHRQGGLRRAGCGKGWYRLAVAVGAVAA